MKNKNNFLIIFILALTIGLIYQGTYIIFSQQFDRESKNGVVLISNSVSQKYVWNRTWGGASNDYGYGVAVDSSNNVYLAGYTPSFGAGGNDVVLVKYDSSGVQQWYRTWGGGGFDVGYGVAVDSADNVYVSGVTESFGAGSTDLVLVKYDDSGVQQWYRTWGDDDIDGAYGVAVDSSDNIYITGYTQSFGVGMYDIAVVKYDGAGTQLWNETWGGGGPDMGYGVVTDSVNNVYIGGVTSFGAGGNDMVIVKYNSIGVQLWNFTWGGTKYDEGYRVTVDSEDNIYLAGYTSSFGPGFADMVIVKYNNIGVQLWNRTWGGSMDEFGWGVATDSADDVYLAGYTSSFGAGSYDMVVVKYDDFGVQQWNKTWGGVSTDYNTDIATDNNDNIYLAGYTASFGEGMFDMILVKFALDFDNPQINIISPSQGDKIGDIAPNYDISIVEANLKSIWYTIDGGITNYTIAQLSGTINQSAWHIAPYSNITIRFYANDLLGYIGYNEVVVEKVEEVEEKDGGPAIFGYNLLIIISLIGMITAIIQKRKSN